MTTPYLGGVFAALIVATPTIAADPKRDREAMIGTWKIVQFHDDGSDKIGRLGVTQVPKGKPERIAKLVVTADEVFVIRADGKRDVLAGLTNTAWKSVTLDPSKDPKQIDIVGQPGKGDKPVKYLGIYKLEDKKLTICWNETPKGNDPEKIRPKKFESDGDMNLFICEKLSDTPEKPKE